MPHRRVMGDAVILCDGTVGVFNGAEQGIAVSRESMQVAGCPELGLASSTGSTREPSRHPAMSTPCAGLEHSLAGDDIQGRQQLVVRQGAVQHGFASSV